MLIKDAVKERMSELGINCCAAVQLSNDKTRPIVLQDDPRMNEELGNRTFRLLDAITSAPSHTCYSGCEEEEEV